ncbi:PF12553 family protein [Bordetella bronchiseptica MO211]|nr:PF12553 family protein [Bordetella bronchiseptica MO211]
MLLWTFKLTVIGALLYFAFWPALLLAFLVAAAHGDWAAEPELPEPEWREGPVGFGLYTYDGHRIDPHDFKDEI